MRMRRRVAHDSGELCEVRGCLQGSHWKSEVVKSSLDSLVLASIILANAHETCSWFNFTAILGVSYA